TERDKKQADENRPDENRPDENRPDDQPVESTQATRGEARRRLSSDPPPRQAPSLLDSRWFAITALALSTLYVLYYARGYLDPTSALGNDASSHITAIARFATVLRDGAGWWAPDYNAGFPLALYYQPLPHLASGLLCLILGGPERAVVTYKLLATFMLAVQPWAVYTGLRRAGLRPAESALAGAMSPLVYQGITFGYSPHPSLVIGLYTQAWGNVVLPLAVGELVRCIHGRGNVWLTAMTASLVASCHMFYAIALLPIVALVFIVRFAVASFTGNPPRQVAREAAAAFARLCLAGLSSAVLLAGWLVPLSRNQAFFGGWPFGRSSRVNGYGWGGEDGLASTLTGGHLMDSAFPFMLALSVVGLLFCVWKLRQPGHAFVLVCVGWATFGLLGRVTFPNAIDWYPLHASVQLFRYGAVLQFALLIGAGVGLAGIVRLLPRVMPAKLPGVLPPLIALYALVYPAIEASDELNTCFRTLSDAGTYNAEEYEALVHEIRQQPRTGRMLVGPKTEVRGHFHGGLLAFMGQRPAGQSYGVGLHDSLHFYTLEYYRPDHAGARARAELFDFRYVVYAPDFAIDTGLVRDVLYESDRYIFARTDVPDEAVTFMAELGSVVGTPRGVREDIRRWMNGNGPDLRVSPVLTTEDPRSREGLTGAPRRVSERQMYAEADAISGEVLQSQTSGSHVSADVRLDEPGLIVAKIGYHPFWSATLDGQPAETVFVYPGFFAVRAEAGTHVFEANYRWPVYTRWLFGFGVLWIIALAVGERWWATRVPRRP
ncbi:MAG: hypothetical protein ACI81R_001507, partial [Bradymonadia bacterium]